MRTGIMSPMDAATSQGWVEHTTVALRQAGTGRAARGSPSSSCSPSRTAASPPRRSTTRLRERDRRVGVASVYRALELLTALRARERLEVGDGDGPLRAAAARRRPPPPPGLRSLRQGRRLRGPRPRGRPDARSRARLAYDVGAHDVVLRGACPDCTRRARLSRYATSSSGRRSPTTRHVSTNARSAGVGRRCAAPVDADAPRRHVVGDVEDLRDAGLAGRLPLDAQLRHHRDAEPGADQPLHRQVVVRAEDDVEAPRRSAPAAPRR